MGIHGTLFIFQYGMAPTFHNKMVGKRIHVLWHMKIGNIKVTVHFHDFIGPNFKEVSH